MGKQTSYSEKDRKYRKRLKDDPERYAEYLKRERERYRLKKEKNVVKMIEEI